MVSSQNAPYFGNIPVGHNGNWIHHLPIIPALTEGAAALFLGDLQGRWFLADQTGRDKARVLVGRPEAAALAGVCQWFRKQFIIISIQ